VDSKVRVAIDTIVLVVNPLPPSAIAEFIALYPDDVVLFITLIQSLLAMGKDFNLPAKPFRTPTLRIREEPNLLALPKHAMTTCPGPGGISPTLSRTYAITSRRNSLRGWRSSVSLETRRSRCCTGKTDAPVTGGLFWCTLWHCLTLQSSFIQQL
jgi:hypothetical protein